MLRRLGVLINEDIIQGRDAAHFVPDGRLTRAESAKILYLSKEAFLDTVNHNDFDFRISGTILEITDVSPDSLMAGETATILFTVKDGYTGDVVDSIDVTDLNVQVVQGSATVDSVTKVGPGVFLATILVDDGAGEGHLNVQISLVYGRLYVVTTDDYFDSLDTDPSTTNSLKLVPNPVAKNNEASIIAIPRDYHGDPVTGLTLSAYIDGGNGSIIQDMAEDPVGSGIYVGVYKAGSVADTFEICVRIMDFPSTNDGCIPAEVK
jgi:hypothetical protein